MSDNKENKVPLEYPSIQQPKKIDPIVDVVENEMFPSSNTNTQQVISKSPQE